MPAVGAAVCRFLGLRSLERRFARELQHKIEQVSLTGLSKPCHQKKRAHGSDGRDGYFPLQGSRAAILSKSVRRM